MNARSKTKEYALRHAEVHSFVDEGLVIAAYIGEAVIGPITHGSHGETLLLKERTLVFRQGIFPNLAKVLKRAQHAWDTQAEPESFQMDLVENRSINNDRNTFDKNTKQLNMRQV